MNNLTAHRLRELLHYDPETGVFTWAQARRVVQPGDIAGSIDNTGYIRIRVARRIYSAHRLAWLYMTGEWPARFIDHANGVRDDNRWENLRLATKSQNHMNVPRLSSNTTGLKGVSRSGRRYRATIGIDGKSYHLGSFPTAKAAHEAYVSAAGRLFGEFANPG